MARLLAPRQIPIHASFAHLRVSRNYVLVLTLEQLANDAGRGWLGIGRIRGLLFCLPMSRRGLAHA